VELARVVVLEEIAVLVESVLVEVPVVICVEAMALVVLVLVGTDRHGGQAVWSGHVAVVTGGHVTGGHKGVVVVAAVVAAEAMAVVVLLVSE
jgi:hypothetical protein